MTPAARNSDGIESLGEKMTKQQNTSYTVMAQRRRRTAWMTVGSSLPRLLSSGPVLPFAGEFDAVGGFISL
jgi:hypothetical protein